MKTDWIVGDVRGVLEIDRDASGSKSGLKGTLALVTALVLALTGACVLVLVRSSRGTA